MGLLVRWLVLTAAIVIASYLISGIEVSGFFQRILCCGYLGLFKHFFSPYPLYPDPPHQSPNLWAFYFCHKRSIIEDGIRCNFRISGSRVLVGTVWRLSDQCGELAVDIIY